MSKRISYPDDNNKPRRKSTKKSVMKKGLLFYVLDFIKAIKKFFKNLVYADVLGDPKKKIVLVYSVIIVILAIFVTTITNKNSYGIYIGDDLAVSIPYDKAVTFEEVYGNIITGLENKEGTKIQLSENVSMKRENAGRKSIVKDVDKALLEVSSKLTYKIEAAQIYVADEYIATVKTEQIANGILDKLAKRFITNDSADVTYEFVEKVEFRKIFVTESELATENNVYDTLSSDYEVSDIYTVQSGDTLSSIAVKMNISLEELLALNSDINVNSVIRIGQNLNIISRRPNLSIRTTETVSRTEPIPFTQETRENANEGTSYNVKSQNGKDGEMEVIEKIIKVNGILQGTEIAETKIITEAVPEIYEVGTRG